MYKNRYLEKITIEVIVKLKKHNSVVCYSPLCRSIHDHIPLNPHYVKHNIVESWPIMVKAAVKIQAIM